MISLLPKKYHPDNRIGIVISCNEATLSFFDVVVHVENTFCVEYLKTYRKIPNVSPGLIEVFKPFLGGLYSGGLIFGGLIFGGHFVLVCEYQDLKIHHNISLLEAKKVFLWANITFTLL